MGRMEGQHGKLHIEIVQSLMKVVGKEVTA